MDILRFIWNTLQCCVTKELDESFLMHTQQVLEYPQVLTLNTSLFKYE